MLEREYAKIGPSISTICSAVAFIISMKLNKDFKNFCKYLRLFNSNQKTLNNHVLQALIAQPFSSDDDSTITNLIIRSMN